MNIHISLFVIALIFTITSIILICSENTKQILRGIGIGIIALINLIYYLSFK